MSDFEKWWLSEKNHEGKNDEYKKECLKGWREASFKEDLSLLRGIGPYCNGWNANVKLSMVFAEQDYSAFQKNNNKEETISTIGNCNIKIFMKIEEPDDKYK